MSENDDIEFDFDFDDGESVRIYLNNRVNAESRRKVKKIKFNKKLIPKIELKNVKRFTNNFSFKEIGKIENKHSEEEFVMPKIQVPKDKDEVKIEEDDEEFQVFGEVEVKPKEKIIQEERKEEKKVEVKSKEKRKLKLKLPKLKKNNKEVAVEDNNNDDFYYEGRFTEPKKRNLLSRIILQQRLVNGSFDYIEDEYENLTQEEVDASKMATSRRGKRLYREVQAYEDADDDIAARKGWLAFKVGLAAVLLAGTVVIATNTVRDFKDQFISTNQTETIQENYDVYKFEVDSFVKKVKEEQGYEFISLSDEKLVDAYVKILQHEKRMYDNQFKNALLRDQEILDRIVSNVYEAEYSSFSEEELRDYRQLAFCVLEVAKPDLFAKDNIFIRNPIVCDTVKAREAAKEKGYKMGLYVNTDGGIHIKNTGRIITSLRLLDETDFIEASKINEGQDLLEQIIKDTLGENYQNMDTDVLRDYKQLVYEMLPDYAKDEYIKNPIDIDLRYKGYEIGD